MAEIQYRVAMKAGADDRYQYDIPTWAKFVTVLNPTDNKIELYSGVVSVADANPNYAQINVPAYQGITLPVPSGSGSTYTVVWRDGGGVTDKQLQLIYSDYNLGINTSYAAATAQNNVAIVLDSVGLAKAAQLPSALDGGSLKVSQQGPISIGGISQLPAALDGSGNLKVSQQGQVSIAPLAQLPAALDGNGNLKVASTVAQLPAALDSNGGLKVSPIAKGIASAKFSGDNTADVVVKNAAGLTYAISTSASVVVTLKDGASNDVFVLNGPGQISFPNPISHSSNIRLALSAAADVFVQFA